MAHDYVPSNHDINHGCEEWNKEPPRIATSAGPVVLRFSNLPRVSWTWQTFFTPSTPIAIFEFDISRYGFTTDVIKDRWSSLLDEVQSFKACELVAYVSQCHIVLLLYNKDNVSCGRANTSSLNHLAYKHLAIAQAKEYLQHRMILLHYDSDLALETCFLSAVDNEVPPLIARIFDDGGRAALLNIWGERSQDVNRPGPVSRIEAKSNLRS